MIKDTMNKGKERKNDRWKQFICKNRDRKNTSKWLREEEKWQETCQPEGKNWKKM